MKFQISITLFLLFFSTALQAAPAVKLKPDIGRYELGFHADILEDQQGTLSIGQVISGEYENQWVRNRQKQPNFAFSDSAYWLRISLTSEMQFKKNWWFEIGFALVDYIDYYVLQNGKVLSSVRTGDRLPFNTRSEDYRNFLFEFELSPNETKQIYIRLRAHDGFHEPSPVTLWDKNVFSFTTGTRNLGIGVYFGIMVVMAIYNLFIFLSVRDSAYAHYVSYIFCFIVWLTAYYGYAFQYLWPNSPDWGNQAIIVSTCCWSIFMIQFVRSFLDTKRLVPWFETLSRAAILILLFNIIFSFTGYYSASLKILLFIGSPLCIASIATGAICLKAGFRPARYFLLAWTVLLLSLVIFCLKIAGVLPVIFVFEKSVQIGSAIEVVLLSLGLADRINVLKTEKEIAQKEAIAAFESSLKLKNDFITSISHELRTPMNAILGGLEIVQKHTVDKLKTPLSIVRGGASDMMNLVNDILTHTEIQSDRITIQAEEVAIHSVLETMHKSYRFLCEEKGLKLDWQVDQLLPKWLTTDEEKLVMILSKLLDNAIKFTDRGDITLNIKFDKSTSPWHFICVISDTGIGIEPEKQEEIFDSYTQSDGGFQRRYGGLGIGLSICKKLTEIMGGELRLENGESKGCKFTVVLPIQSAEEPVMIKNKNLASSDLPILVVEDNLVNQKVMIKLLERIGYKALIANHGGEALDLLEKETVSAILMDLQMPVMDGFTCTEKIRASNGAIKNIPIIAVTANLMDADKERCIECGMDDYLKKPINMDLLRTSLSRYVEPKNETTEEDTFVMVGGKLIKDRRKIS